MTSPPPPGPAPGALGRIAARGALVTLSAQLARIAVQVVSVVVLARLLSPSDYGLFALALTIVGIGEIFRDFGLSSAAIQAKDLTRAQRDNLFWLNGAIGLVLAAIVFTSSPLIAAFYHQPHLEPVVRAISLTFVLNGLATQVRADLVRGLRFTALATVDVTAPALGLVAAILGAIGGLSYWALVVQQLVQAGLMLVLLASFARFVPGPPRRGVPMSHLLRFGWHLVASQLVGYVSNNVDTVVIGLRFGRAPLGVYNRGYQLLMTPLAQLRTPMTSVALPVLSRLQDDERRFEEFIVRAQLAIGYTLVVGLALIVGAAEPITRVFLGERWDAAAPVLRFLAVAGAFSLLAFVGYWTYLSRGLTASLFRYSLVSMSIKVVAIVVGSHWGITGVAIGAAVAAGISWPVSLRWLARLTAFPARRLTAGALRILALALAVAAFAGGASALTATAPPALRLAASVGGGVIAYGLSVAVPRVRRDLVGVLELGRSVLRERSPRA